ncbi:Uncharacterised protein [Kocuria rosea]|nr:Uncharacterised protein [Kocuria rosea]
MARAMSALMVSRTGLPLSQVSATASISRFCSIRSATRCSTSARSATGVFPQTGAAAHAASSAASMSSAVPRATSVKGLPLTGEMFSKYWPLTGATHCPPIQCS